MSRRRAPGRGACPPPVLAAAVLAGALLGAASSVAAAQAPAAGAALFQQNCAACHQASGSGVPGAFPRLVGDPIVLGPADRLSALILRGRGGMPSFRDDLNDAQIAAVLTYVRGAWGNHAAPVAATAVKTARGVNAPAPPSQAIQAH